jgi:hypothetical protein
MFYQNNNDYMRDAFYYSGAQNNTYPYGGMNNYGQTVMPMNVSAFGNNMNMQPQMQTNSLSNMYPQVYRIIEPVANRVISNSNYPYYTEDNLNNLVDTVYNIVEGDVASLTSSTIQNSGDDTVTQGPARGASNGNSSNVQKTVSSTEQLRKVNDSSLLRDLIKIIIIKQILSRNCNSNNNCNMNNNMGSNMGNSMSNMNYYDPRFMGMI